MKRKNAKSLERRREVVKRKRRDKVEVRVEVLDYGFTCQQGRLPKVRVY